MALVGFARVSTQSQDLTNQVNALTEAGCSKIFQSKHSGKKEANKQAIDELLSYVREGDTVVVTKLDRIGRSLNQVLTLIEELTSRKITLRAIDQNIDTGKTDPLNQAMVQLLGMFSELERNFIVTRTKEGKEVTGNLGGRPSKLDDKAKQAIKNRHTHGGESISSLAKAFSISRATVGRIVGTVEP